MIETMHTKSLEFGLDFLRRGLNFFVFETKNFFRQNAEASKNLFQNAEEIRQIDRNSKMDLDVNNCDLLKFLDVTEAPSEDILRDQEANIFKYGEMLREEGKTKEMTDLIQKVRNFLRFMSKAKAAKLVRALVDMFLEMERSEPRGEREVQLCKVRLKLYSNAY